MANLSRSAALTGFANLARAKGLDPYRLAREAGVPAPALSNPDLRISAASVGRILEAAAHQSGGETFGLELAETRQLSNMGAVALVAREQPSLRKALEVMGLYQWMQSDALNLHVDERGDYAIAKVGMATAGKQMSRQAIELSVAVLCRNIRSLLHRQWLPQAVCFTHARPGRLAIYRRVVGMAPEFGQSFNGIVFARRDLDLPIETADPDLAREIGRYLDALAAKRAQSTRSAVEELIVLLMPSGLCTAERVAKHMDVDRRTIHRRLAREGTRFSDLLALKRTELARTLLSNGTQPIAVIAEQLGFSDASAFTHWFRRTHRGTPRDYRQTKRLRAAVP